MEDKIKKLSFILIIALSPLLAVADKGSIPYNTNADIFEPNQRAMIAWNGETEILLLTTELYASEDTNVLEVIPLPAEPDVKKGEFETFEKAVSTINKKVRIKDVISYGRTIKAVEQGDQAGEITFQAKIGAHDISVAKVLDENGFVSWVEDFLKKKGAQTVTVPEKFRKIINEYLKDDFKWFVFDVVSLTKEPKAIEPIQYTFKTDYLFYPMRISTMEKGGTTVDLIILTPKLFKNFPALSRDKIHLRHTPIDVTEAEIRKISEDMAKILKGRGDCKLRIWRCNGDLSEFNQDIIAKE